MFPPLCCFTFQAAIRKELNEYKSNEMEVHASSKHLTRSDSYCVKFVLYNMVFISLKRKEKKELCVQGNEVGSAENCTEQSGCSSAQKGSSQAGEGCGYAEQYCKGIANLQS